MALRVGFLFNAAQRSISIDQWWRKMASASASHLRRLWTVFPVDRCTCETEVNKDRDPTNEASTLPSSSSDGWPEVVGMVSTHLLTLTIGVYIYQGVAAGVAEGVVESAGGTVLQRHFQPLHTGRTIYVLAPSPRPFRPLATPYWPLRWWMAYLRQLKKGGGGEPTSAYTCILGKLIWT